MKYPYSKRLNIPLSVSFTSEENSYGLAGGRWFDGSFKVVQLKSGVKVKIVNVNEDLNIDSLCSKDSFYRCLAKRYQEVHRYIGTTVNCKYYRFEML